jgi:uncharacterized protein (DUF1330 family)
MSAYIVAQVEVRDVERFRAYQALAAPVVTEFGGSFLASSSDVRALEGAPRPQRLVIVGMDSLARCHAFYDCPGYQAAIRARAGVATLDILAAEGLDAAAPRGAADPLSARRAAMPAYVVAEVKVTDPAKYESYKQLAPPAVAKYGGRYIARGGKTVTLEGDWKPERLVLLEFPSLAQAEAFYNSPEYGKARAARKGAASMRLLAVEGL